MKHYSRLVLIGLAALVSLIMFLPAPLALAQGPVDAENDATNTQLPLIPVPEFDGGNDPNAGMPEILIPSQGVPENQADLVIEPLSTGAESGGNILSIDMDPADLEPGNLPSGEPPAGTQPASLDGARSALDSQVKALLGKMADQLLERLQDWMHREADQVSDSFNRWLHQEVDRLLASFERWLAEQLSETDGASAIELKPLEG